MLSERIFVVKFEIKHGLLFENNVEVLKSCLSQYLIDFKTRDIINKETKNIREILLIKAFANNDEFEDYNLIDNEQK